MNRIGHSSPAFCHDPIDATAQAVEEAGFDVWEIVGEGRHDLDEHRDAFRDALGSVQVTPQLHAPISDCNLGSLFPGMWEHSVSKVERALHAAADLDIRRVTIHPGNHTPYSRDHYDQLHEATRRAVHRLDRAGRDLGLELNLENMAHGWAFETDSLQKLLDLTDGTRFRLTFDYGHAHVSARVDEFRAAAGQFGNVHVHDNRGDVDAHMTLGDGTLPWEDVTRDLLAGGYDGTLVIESRSHPSGAASLEKLRALVRQVLA